MGPHRAHANTQCVTIRVTVQDGNSIAELLPDQEFIAEANEDSFADTLQDTLGNPLAKSIPVGHGITHTFGVAFAECDAFTHGLAVGERVAVAHDDTECLTDGAFSLRDGCPDGDYSTDPEPWPNGQSGTDGVADWSSTSATVTDQRTGANDTTANGPRTARSASSLATGAA